jgi:hypothetical protein
LESIFLPPSIEIIDPILYPFSDRIPHYFVVDNPEFCVINDCLMPTNGRTVIQYLGSAETFLVSEAISHLSAGCFMGSSSLRTLIFDEGSQLKSLPANSFYQCDHIRFVRIPKSVRVIGDNCFEKCYELVEISFESPSAIRTIESDAFSDCESLTSFTVPSSVTTLGSSVFSGCSGLSSVTFEAPSHVEDIPTCLFECCLSLTVVDLPDSVKTIAGDAFESSGVTFVTGPDCIVCGSLFIQQETLLRCLGEPWSVRIPASVREIGGDAFCAVTSLIDLTFEQGVQQIGANGFRFCQRIQIIAFPASLVVIEECAFCDCTALRFVTFAPGSNLESLGNLAFAKCPLQKVVLPATVIEIEPSTFSAVVWPVVTFENPPLLISDDNFLYSADSSMLFANLSLSAQILIPAHIEAIGFEAFTLSNPMNISFVIGTKLREIGDAAFSGCSELTEFTVPSSVEIIGDRCFENCCHLATVTLEEVSQLRKIGASAFSGCNLNSLTIPASTEEIDGSAFVNCPLLEIRVVAGSQNFTIQGNFLTTADGKEIVRCFGSAIEVIVPMNVEVLGKSCFESCIYIEGITFENGSRLKKIGRSALCGCESLVQIAIPGSVEIIEDRGFKKCDGLEACLMDEDETLAKIENDAFAECRSLRSFDFPKRVEGIGHNCFQGCGSLSRLKFESGQSLAKIMGDLTLDESLEQIGFHDISSAFEIEVEQGGVELDFPGWVTVDGEASYLTLVQGM